MPHKMLRCCLFVLTRQSRPHNQLRCRLSTVRRTENVDKGTAERQINRSQHFRSPDIVRSLLDGPVLRSFCLRAESPNSRFAARQFQCDEKFIKRSKVVLATGGGGPGRRRARTANHGPRTIDASHKKRPVILLAVIRLIKVIYLLPASTRAGARFSFALSSRRSYHLRAINACEQKRRPKMHQRSAADDAKSAQKRPAHSPTQNASIPDHIYSLESRNEATHGKIIIFARINCRNIWPVERLSI